MTKYGEVKTCKRINDSVAIILVTWGFKTDSASAFIDDCTAKFPDLPNVAVCIIEDDFAMVVLRS